MAKSMSSDAMNQQECIYLDTNILISLLINDGLTAAAEEWVANQTSAFAISAWTRAETNAVIGLRKRKGEFTSNEARAAIKEFAVRADTYLQTIPVSNDAAALAAEWLRDPDCPLQTGDALHLAVAQIGGATVVATFDARFAKAAQKLKLRNMQIELIGAKPRRAAQQRATYVVKAEKSIRKSAKKRTKLVK
jgi:predicted nucleic acid-binding protein